jgi:hypothetical protein
MTNKKKSVKKPPTFVSTPRRALGRRMADLLSQHQKERWPEAKIVFGGYYPELTQEQRDAEPELSPRIEAQQELERQRHRWLVSLNSVLNDAYRYLLDVRYTETLQIFTQHPLWLFKEQPPDEKVRLDYLEKPIVKDLESMNALIASTGRRTPLGRSARKADSLTVRSVLLLIAREARGQKQQSAAGVIGIPQSHLSRLETGQRPWTTKNRAQCADYVSNSPRDGIARAFLKLAAREFRSS